MASEYNTKDDEIAALLVQLEEEENELATEGVFIAPDVSDSTANYDCDENDPDYEPQEIEVNEEDSDDIDLDVLEENEEEGNNDDMRFYIGKDENTIWASKPVAPPSKTRPINTVRTVLSPKGQARQCRTRLECFSQIITPENVKNIVIYTNICIENKKREREIHADGSAFRARDYKPTTSTEILAMFGALFLMAVKKGNRADLSESFNKNGTGLMILRANFSERRFRFLLRCLRFDDIHTRNERKASDKLAPCRELLNSFTANSQKAFSLGEYATIDEMLVAFRGRCSFIQYMAKKPAKYGLKIYALCDARLHYTFDLEVYCGKQPDDNAISNKPYDVVVRLVQSIQGTNRNVTAHNYFTSYALAEHLLGLKLTFLGTMKRDKAEIPPEFVTTEKKSVPGSYKFGWQPDKTLISMITQKKKAVLVLSTMHDRDTVHEETGKPMSIMDYNFTKGGVDKVDLMCSRISTSRVTKRWPMVVFFRLLDLAGINSLRIYQLNNPLIVSKRRTYLFDLSFELMHENLKIRSQLPFLPKDLKLFLGPHTEQGEESANDRPAPIRRGICHICGPKKNNRTRLECNGCGKNVCKQHSLSVITCRNCQERQRSRDDSDMEID